MISILYLEMRIAYYQLALRSVHPLHQDVPFIVMHLLKLKEQQCRRRVL
jgi:hypothetical protein